MDLAGLLGSQGIWTKPSRFIRKSGRRSPIIGMSITIWDTPTTSPASSLTLITISAAGADRCQPPRRLLLPRLTKLKEQDISGAAARCAARRNDSAGRGPLPFRRWAHLQGTRKPTRRAVGIPPGNGISLRITPLPASRPKRLKRPWRRGKREVPKGWRRTREIHSPTESEAWLERCPHMNGTTETVAKSGNVSEVIVMPFDN